MRVHSLEQHIRLAIVYILMSYLGSFSVLGFKDAGHALKVELGVAFVPLPDGKVLALSGALLYILQRG
jgi:hypothetical protein